MTTLYNTPMTYTLTIKTNTVVIKNAEKSLVKYVDELNRNGKSDVYVYEDRVVIEDRLYQRLGMIGRFISDMLELAQEGEIVLFEDNDGKQQITLA